MAGASLARRMLRATVPYYVGFGNAPANTAQGEHQTESAIGLDNLFAPSCNEEVGTSEQEEREEKPMGKDESYDHSEAI